MSSEDFEFNISISGNQNDSNLVLGSNSGIINDNNSSSEQKMLEEKTSEKINRVIILGDHTWDSGSWGWKTIAPQNNILMGEGSSLLTPNIVSHYLTGKYVYPRYYHIIEEGTGKRSFLDSHYYNNYNYCCLPPRHTTWALYNPDSEFEYERGLGGQPGEICKNIPYFLDKMMKDILKPDEKDLVLLNGKFLDIVVIFPGMFLANAATEFKNGDTFANLFKLNGVANPPTGTFFEVLEKWIELNADLVISNINKLKAHGFKKIVYELFKMEEYATLKFIRNVVIPPPLQETFYNTYLSILPIFDNKIINAFKDDPNVYIHVFDEVKLGNKKFINSNGVGAPYFINKDVPLISGQPTDLTYQNQNLYVLSKVLEDANFVSAVDFTSKLPEGSNVLNSMYTTFEQYTQRVHELNAQDMLQGLCNKFNMY